MRWPTPAAAPAAPAEPQDAADIGQHAQLLSLATLRVLAALRFDEGVVPELAWKVRYEVSELATIVERLDVVDRDGLALAARGVLRSGLLATRSTLVALEVGSWTGKQFEAAEAACADLVKDQEEFARRFKLGVC